MTVVLTVIAPLFLLATLAPGAVAQLTFWMPPSRVVLEACSAGLLLLVGSLVLPMAGWFAVAWWLVLALCATATGVATWRAATSPPPRPEDLVGRAAVTARPVGTRSLIGHVAAWVLVALVALLGG